MASSYPGAVDALTNPTATDAMNSVTVPHATQHANANDAIEAIQTELGTDPAGASATVKARLDAVDSDARWTNARTPTAHATSHNDGGSDEITVAESQVTGLTTALAGKAATVALWLPGTTGNYVSCPDSAALDIVGDIDMRVKVSMDDWTPAATSRLMGKVGSAGQRSYVLTLLTTGVLRLSWYADGTTAISKDATAATGLTDGTVKWVRVTLDVDNGATQNEVKFWLSDDDVTYTQLGSTVTTAGVTSIAAGTAPLEVGAYSGGADPCAGKFYRARLLNGIGGTPVADLDLTNGVGPRIRDSLNNLWTINGTANGWQA